MVGFPTSLIIYYFSLNFSLLSELPQKTHWNESNVFSTLKFSARCFVLDGVSVLLNFMLWQQVNFTEYIPTLQ